MVQGAFPESGYFTGIIQHTAHRISVRSHRHSHWHHGSDGHQWHEPENENRLHECHHCLLYTSGHLEGTVTAYGNDLTVHIRTFGADGCRDGISHGAHTAGGEEKMCIRDRVTEAVT